MEEEKKIDDADAIAAPSVKVVGKKAKAGESPMSFKAGGGGRSPSNASKMKKGGCQSTETCPQPTPQPLPKIHPMAVTSSNIIENVPALRSVVRSGLDGKRSALEVKNWIVCLLTLDGRDKFTKVLQYTSRMMCWYFAVLANRTVPGGIVSGSSSIVDASSGAASFLSAVYTNLDLRKRYYVAISKRFNELCQAFVTSRKAFRIGRSIIEWDKIASMGVFDYLNYMLLQPLADSPTIMKESAILPPTLPVISTPSWKLVGTTIKFLGLMGFWAFDNIAFVTGSGFLDPIIDEKKIIHGQPHPALNYIDVDNVVLVNPNSSDRTKRKTWSGEWANRFYFMGSIGGFYVNARSLWVHRNTELRRAREKFHNAIADSNGIEEAKVHLEKTQRDHFDLCVAMAKSIADVMVFGNNPGVDLFVKFRGKKNHEGLHCVGGLVSASTVLYNSFPNA